MNNNLENFLCCMTAATVAVAAYALEDAALKAHDPLTASPRRPEYAVVNAGTRKAEFAGYKVVQRVRDPKGGTNAVWRTAREFPLMFSKPSDKKPKKNKPSQ